MIKSSLAKLCLAAVLGLGALGIAGVAPGATPPASSKLDVSDLDGLAMALINKAAGDATFCVEYPSKHVFRVVYPHACPDMDRHRAVFEIFYPVPGTFLNNNPGNLKSLPHSEGMEYGYSVYTVGSENHQTELFEKFIGREYQSFICIPWNVRHSADGLCNASIDITGGGSIYVRFARRNVPVFEKFSTEINSAVVAARGRGNQ